MKRIIHSFELLAIGKFAHDAHCTGDAVFVETMPVPCTSEPCVVIALHPAYILLSLQSGFVEHRMLKLHFDIDRVFGDGLGRVQSHKQWIISGML